MIFVPWDLPLIPLDRGPKRAPHAGSGQEGPARPNRIARSEGTARAAASFEFGGMQEHFHGDPDCNGSQR